MNDFVLAGALLAIDPGGLGGAILRGSPCPEREAWLESLRELLPASTPFRRLPSRIDDDRLLGGLDLAASLATGQLVVQRGVLAEADGGVVVVPMAERLDAELAARLCGALDTGDISLQRGGLNARTPARIAIVALDEGLDDVRAPEALADRIAFRLDVSDEAGDKPFDARRIARARRRLQESSPPDDAIVEALCAAATAFGIDSLRAPIFALKAAQANAALHGRLAVDAEDAAVATRLVLAPCARCAPQTPAEPAPNPPEDAGGDMEPTDASVADKVSDVVVMAERAALPTDLFGASATSPRGPSPVRSRGAGSAAKSAARGRPAGVRPGRLSSGVRLNVIETLRAAAPWQRMRRGPALDGLLQVRPCDFRLQKFVQRRESTTIFVVDASGSTALQRLAEAKGAVELLLAKAYVSRARVALISFRGLGADLLLPPTRSLARARACLAALPGGGGTPLASALDIALAVALGERKRGATPQIVVLTDGRANIARGGVAGRPAAVADAQNAAQAIGDARIASVFIDTAPRPEPSANRFAAAMAGAYRHLPFLNAQSLADAVGGPAGRR